VAGIQCIDSTFSFGPHRGIKICDILANILFSMCMIVMVIWALLPQPLRHCATTQKVAGLIPVGAIGVFLLLATLWPWGQLSLLTETSTRCVSWGIKGAGA